MTDAPTPPPHPPRLDPAGLGPMRGYARRAADRTGYLTPAGKLPSVTTVLGATSAGKARLQQWLSRPGAEAISDEAKRRGTYTHECIEHWIAGATPRRTFGSALKAGLYGAYWTNVQPWLETHFTRAIGIEAPVWHPAGFSGTFDCLGTAAAGSAPDALTLLDWKTAARSRGTTHAIDGEAYHQRHLLPNNADLLQDYFCQLGAYRAAITHTYGHTATRALLVIARPTPSTVGPDVYELPPALLDHYEAEFFLRLKRYYTQSSIPI